jgi:hypothetical protein
MSRIVSLVASGVRAMLSSTLTPSVPVRNTSALSLIERNGAADVVATSNDDTASRHVMIFITVMG